MTFEYVESVATLKEHEVVSTLLTQSLMKLAIAIPFLLWNKKKEMLLTQMSKLAVISNSLGIEQGNPLLTELAGDDTYVVTKHTLVRERSDSTSNVLAMCFENDIIKVLPKQRSNVEDYLRILLENGQTGFIPHSNGSPMLGNEYSFTKKTSVNKYPGLYAEIIGEYDSGEKIRIYPEITDTEGVVSWIMVPCKDDKWGWVKLSDLEKVINYRTYNLKNPTFVLDDAGTPIATLLTKRDTVNVITPKETRDINGKLVIGILYENKRRWLELEDLGEMVTGTGGLVTKRQLTDIMNAANHFQANAVNDAMVSELNDMLQKYNIIDKQQIQMFLAVIVHESRLALTEAGWLSNAAIRQHCLQYEPGTSKGNNLGNTVAGDGYLFRGSGYIQLTGRDNYDYFSAHIKNKSGEDVDIMINGADCIESKYAWIAAGYFWEKNNINQVIANGNTSGLATMDIFKKISNAVYQGNSNASSDPDGWSDRKNRLNEVMSLYY